MPAYRVETARLVLRCWNPVDASLLQEAMLESLAHVRDMPWAGQEPMSIPDRADLLRRFRGDFDCDRDRRYAILDSSERQVLGGTGLHPRVGPGATEIGYWIRAGAVQQGLATEAAAALIKIAFEVERVDRVEIHCAPENLASAAIPRRHGFRHEATLRRRRIDVDGKPRDEMIWSLLAEEYRAGPLAALPIAAYDAIGSRLL